jgi:S-adenosylmethionine:tRNA ribosyltransferase-isomerase
LSEDLHSLLYKPCQYSRRDLVFQGISNYLPPLTLKIVKAIITNFHQPNSTLLLLVAAIVGDAWKSIYNYALDNGFRFLSYGDGSLLFAK